jgi:hypothetical protein
MGNLKGKAGFHRRYAASILVSGDGRRTSQRYRNISISRCAAREERLERILIPSEMNISSGIIVLKTGSVLGWTHKWLADDVVRKDPVD